MLPHGIVVGPAVVANCIVGVLVGEAGFTVSNGRPCDRGLYERRSLWKGAALRNIIQNLRISSGRGRARKLIQARPRSSPGRLIVQGMLL